MPSGVVVSTDAERAARVLRAGGLVAIPTETVYGLSADADQPAAVERIFTVKGRPAGHPLIVHVDGARALEAGWARAGEAARLLAAAFWPGPVTLLLPRGPRTPDAVTGGLDTVGLRAPAHPMAQELLAQLGPGSGLAAPSANRFGRTSPTSAAHVLADLGEHLDADRDLVLDGGPATVGVESTILDLTDPGRPALLRPGAVGAGELSRVLGIEVGYREAPGLAPGTLAGHYAPRARVLLAAAGEAAAAVAAGKRVALLAVERPAGVGTHVTFLAMSRDPTLAAAQLYAQLRAADAAGVTTLVVVPPLGEHPAAVAVRDRLRRAETGTWTR